APDAVRWLYHDAYKGATWAADNPPQGARIYYWLKSAPKGEVAIDILDDRGALVDTLSSKPREVTGSSEYTHEEEEAGKKLAIPKEAGVQVATWNLIWAGAETIPGGKLDAGFPAIGPNALPGTYTVRLTVDGKSQTTTLTLKPDPRQTVAAADLAAQLGFAL